MDHKKQTLFGILLAALSLVVHASPVTVVESRPSRLSQAQESSNLMLAKDGSASSYGDGSLGMLLNNIQTMQEEILQLRGLMEEQERSISRLSRENKDRYLDLDARVSQLQQTVGELEQKKYKSDKVEDAVETKPSVQVSEQNSTKGSELYQEAVSSIKSRDFSGAIEKLDQYVKVSPNGKFVGHSYYWLGEIALSQGNLDDAKQYFEKVLKAYPDNPKVSDATYKLGQIGGRMGNTEAEEAYMKKVVESYPQSAAARLADTYLQTKLDE